MDRLRPDGRALTTCALRVDDLARFSASKFVARSWVGWWLDRWVGVEEIQLSGEGMARSRRRNVTWAALASFLVFPIVLLVFVVGFISIYWGDVRTLGDVLWLIAAEAIAIGAGVSGGRFALRCWKASILISADQVVVTNPWRTYQVDLTEIDELRGKPVDVGFGNPVPGVVVRLRNGSEIFVWTLANECFIWSIDQHARRWDKVAEMLNSRVESLRASAS